MVVEHDALASGKFSDESFRQVTQNVSSVGVINKFHGVKYVDFASDWWEGGHVVWVAGGDYSDSFVAQAYGPDGEDVSGVVLFHGPFDDKLGVLGPSLSEIDGFVSSGEEDTVDFG